MNWVLKAVFGIIVGYCSLSAIWKLYKLWRSK